jgi:hypothetical protein
MFPANKPFRELVHTFEKRHPITHNLGVIDRKYLERMRSAEHEGREVMVTPDEITQVDNNGARVLESVSHLHGKLFGNLAVKLRASQISPSFLEGT